MELRPIKYAESVAFRILWKRKKEAYILYTTAQIYKSTYESDIFNDVLYSKCGW